MGLLSAGQQMSGHVLCAVWSLSFSWLTLFTPRNFRIISSELYRAEPFLHKADSNPASTIPFHFIHFIHLFSKRSSMIKGAHVNCRVLDTVLYPFSKVFPLAGFMPFKPGI